MAAQLIDGGSHAIELEQGSIPEGDALIENPDMRPPTTWLLAVC